MIRVLQPSGFGLRFRRLDLMALEPLRYCAPHMSLCFPLPSDYSRRLTSRSLHLNNDCLLSKHISYVYTLRTHHRATILSPRKHAERSSWLPGCISYTPSLFSCLVKGLLAGVLVSSAPIPDIAGFRSVLRILIFKGLDVVRIGLDV